MLHLLFNFKVMKRVLKNIIILLLTVTSLSALYGGLNLILQPDGSSLKLAPAWLIDVPFKDFMIPGLVTFSFYWGSR
ncbi:hypothetical protein D3C87_853260 [compost metagenome]